MVLKLYGFPQSTTVKIVAIVLYEKKVPFEYVEVDVFARAHKEADYLEKQPFGQIPCIDDNGFILYESRAIGRYLVENYPEHGDQLIPSDPKKRALFEQAVSSEASNFDRFATPLVIELLFKKNGETDLAKVEDLKNNLSQKLDVYDKILSKQKYLAGDSVTLADLFHLPGGQLMIKAGLTLIEDRPNVARWFNEISSRESWQMVKDGVGPCKF
ncbi:Glutathione S-transferase F8, chloroplastic [Leucoagaricus sp. SymC.cos]|nr:Glutathione S-transferase F8, chloroplastic [Leucoagaricus sp. SymC.cos]